MSHAAPNRWPESNCRPASLPLIPLAAGLPFAIGYRIEFNVPGPGQGLMRRGGLLDSAFTEDSASLGDAKSRFARVVLPHLPAAYALARSLTRNPSDAEDVVQEACLRAYRAIGNTAVANGRAWLLTIVHNTAYTWLRKNRPAAIIAVDNLEATEQMQTASPGVDSETPETAVIARTDGVRLEAAIQELPALFREVLALREVEGLSYREIAEVTGVPIGTVMSRLARARERLIAAIGRNPS
jgi:RNA polymerase sigma-70 factor, ECF subfamily